MPSPDDQPNAAKLDESIEFALANDRTIDITTTGRKSGQPRRIEIWFHQVDGHIYITGLPGPRAWYANLLGHPDFIFHLKGSVQADLPARARALRDPRVLGTGDSAVGLRRSQRKRPRQNRGPVRKAGVPGRVRTPLKP